MNRLTIKASSGLIHLKDNAEMTINTAIKKLSDLEDLEEQGKLMKLPCAVGDTVYVVIPYAGHVKEEVITGVSIRSNVIFMMCDDEAGYSENVFGKTVFITREKAEDALKEMRERKKNEVN